MTSARYPIDTCRIKILLIGRFAAVINTNGLTINSAFISGHQLITALTNEEGIRVIKVTVYGMISRAYIV